MLLPWFFFITAEEVRFNNIGHNILNQYLSYLTGTITHLVTIYCVLKFILIFDLTTDFLQRNEAIPDTMDFQPGN